MVNKLIEDENVDVVFNTIKYMKDILGAEYSVSMTIYIIISDVYVMEI